MSGTEYDYYRKIVEGQTLPCAFVDLDRFDRNIQDILARAGSMPICVASKSIRCVTMLRRVLAASPQFRSIMAYSCREAVFLANHGFDQILIAYPVLREAEAEVTGPAGAPAARTLAEALRQGKTIRLMVDSPEHVEHLEQVGARAGVVIPLCIDLDMSSSFPGLHFGVRRSPLRTPEQAVALWREIERRKHLRLDGLMGYEAQIAGVQDSAGPRAKQMLIRRLKKKSVGEVRARRRAVVEALRAAGAPLQFVNGGGTGSVESTTQEEVVTEVTVGSGFYSPTLFDGYDRFKHLPAAGFALEITRVPMPGVYTCHGGGYVASGPAGSDRLPRPYLPEGGRLLPLEGAGEVQTPVTFKDGLTLRVGDPIFFRHAKAGELCERFNEVLLISEGQVTGAAATYRGEGMSFL